MTITHTPSHSGPNAQKAASEHCEDSDSPADAPDTYAYWHSPNAHRIENNIADKRWLSLLEEAKPLCVELADNVAKMMSYPCFSLSILWTDDAQMAEMNQQFRQKKGPTNILSFPAIQQGENPEQDGAVFLGDMALGFDTLIREAEESQRPASHHLAHLFVHGLLHLAGYDHQEDTEAEEMESLEIAFLADLELPNPYLDIAKEKGQARNNV